MPNLSTGGQGNATLGAKNTNPHTAISKPAHNTRLRRQEISLPPLVPKFPLNTVHGDHSGLTLCFVALIACLLQCSCSGWHTGNGKKLSNLPGPVVPGCSLVSRHILWAILSKSTVHGQVKIGQSGLGNLTTRRNYQLKVNNI